MAEVAQSHLPMNTTSRAKTNSVAIPLVSDPQNRGTELLSSKYSASGPEGRFGVTKLFLPVSESNCCALGAGAGVGLTGRLADL